jgi:hypothetical protein
MLSLHWSSLNTFRVPPQVVVTVHVAAGHVFVAETAVVWRSVKGVPGGHVCAPLASMQARKGEGKAV